MREFLRGFVLVAGVVAALGWLTAPLAAQGTIVGRVTSVEFSRPIPSAFVEVLAADGRRVASAVTNQDGAFRVTNVEPGSYEVAAQAAGFARRAQSGVQVTANATASVDLALDTEVFALDPVVVTPTRGVVEKALDAPARVEVVTERDIDARPAITPVDHLRSTPAVDVVTTGVQGTFVVVRGFNNIFSGSLHTLTDNRIAGIPSLRVNLMHFVPQTNEDIQQMEVVLGPGSALYGPNTANGVLHMITKSPLDDAGTTFSIAGGERSALQVAGRTAIRASDNFGFKISGQYFRADEWEFTDSVEVAARTLAQTSFAAWAATQPTGLSQAELQQRAARLALRDFDVERWSIDGRADWRPSPEFGAIFSAGTTNAAKGIEMTGIGAAQVEDWFYSYYQARFQFRDWFAQAYLNTSNAGDTYLLRTGAPIVDESKVLVGQIQHGADLGNRLQFTYGADYIRTTPETGGTINGSREDDDNYDQYGLYLQGRVTLTPRLDLVAAGREDWHTELNDPVFSPRAALVFKPTPAHTFRATYNRAFSTPTSLNLFLDIDGGPAGPLGPLGFRVRAQGPGKNGIRLVGDDGLPLGIRTPFFGQPAALAPATTSTLYEAQLNALIAQTTGTPNALPASLQAYLRSLKDDPVLTALGISALNPSTGQVVPLAPGVISDVPGIEPSISNTIEFGYKGIFGDRLALAADLWRSTEKDFTSPLVLRTPVLKVDSTSLVGYLTPRVSAALQQSGIPQPIANAQAAAIAAGMARIPAGVASSPDVAARGSDLLATYVNFGELDLWGVDLSATALLSDEWSIGATASFVSDHNFCLVETTGQCPTAQLVALNAPSEKATGTVTYRGLTNGINAEIRGRHTGEFPVNSADFVGLRCIGGGGNACVDSYTIFDMTLGYRVPTWQGASIQLAITNLFDEGYRSFVGVPEVGRMALLRLRYDF